jgi:hypothetical protein
MLREVAQPKCSDLGLSVGVNAVHGAKSDGSRIGSAGLGHRALCGLPVLDDDNRGEVNF